ncbi:MAG: cysteine synthase A [Oscillospiraceae bacterium]|nr:cysteine synthase A [Candidatus Equicaccousia limihippi]
MKFVKSIEENIGGTPLIRSDGFCRALNLTANIYAKAECFNPAGSIKDRAALYLVNDAEKRGLKSGGTIIEPTSGNTGIGLAAICAARGYRLILTMPESMSIERRKLLAGYGAKIVLTPASEGMAGSVKKADELLQNTENSFLAGQFDNPANPLSHFETTAPEIEKQLGEMPDAIISSFGTGGTVSGIGRYFKQQNAKTIIVGVEPDTSPLISKGYAGGHGIQGIGANFVPKNLDLSVIDKVVTATLDDSFKYARLFAKSQGLLVGISSGAALAAAVEFAKMPQFEGKNIVVILPDGGDRYLSTELFE